MKQSDKPENWERKFAERLVKFAKEQVLVGRNYGWSIDTLAEELHTQLQQVISDTRAEINRNYWEKIIPQAKQEGIEEVIKAIGEWADNNWKSLWKDQGEWKVTVNGIEIENLEAFLSELKKKGSK